MAKKGAAMASFHLAVKAISRGAGRSATAAAAYRAGVEIEDERTGLVHDYTRKQGVEHQEIVAPDDVPAWARDRAALWNAAEAVERRKDAKVAREYEIALPAELDAAQRRDLALGFAREISNRYGWRWMWRSISQGGRGTTATTMPTCWRPPAGSARRAWARKPANLT
jgi:hypothetical protein